MAALIPFIGVTVAQGLSMIVEQGLPLLAQGLILGTSFAATAEGVHDIATAIRKAKNNDQQQPLSQPVNAQKQNNPVMGLLPSDIDDLRNRLTTKIPDMRKSLDKLKSKMSKK